ncbi:Uncharacterized protein HZ326_2011 [Fusarium oxysporum f. sp. albedinis]|nr:Uncharacterized protein HZ326_2011 [Fusarium oxysporum f. sp. albedinis]
MLSLAVKTGNQLQETAAALSYAWRGSSCQPTTNHSWPMGEQLAFVSRVEAEANKVPGHDVPGLASRGSR